MSATVEHVHGVVSTSQSDLSDQYIQYGQMLTDLLGTSGMCSTDSSTSTPVTVNRRPMQTTAAAAA
jgi:hypothetical protein